MKTLFTSDTHWSHKNILAYQPNRSIFKDIADHDEQLIDRWNSKVGVEDTVWHLGDFALSGINRINEIAWKLNGKINLILGNHDDAKLLEKTNRFDSIQDVKMITINGQKIFLSHYAHRVWDKSHRGVLHLYGHSHGSLPDDPNSLSFDVGVDCHNFYPLSFEEVTSIMAKKTFKPVDHHKERE
jgi:calcineurin-like phosphoesterase family protein